MGGRGLSRPLRYSSDTVLLCSVLLAVLGTAEECEYLQRRHKLEVLVRPVSVGALEETNCPACHQLFLILLHWMVGYVALVLTLLSSRTPRPETGTLDSGQNIEVFIITQQEPCVCDSCGIDVL
jgi:hypothetical protein